MSDQLASRGKGARVHRAAQRLLDHRHRAGIQAWPIISRSKGQIMDNIEPANSGETYSVTMEPDDNLDPWTVVHRDRDGREGAVIKGPLDEDALAREGFRIVGGPWWDHTGGRATVQRIDTSGGRG